jgi:hypothetical protein
VRVVEGEISLPTYPFASYLQTDVATDSGIPFERLNWEAYTAAAPSAVLQRYRTVVLDNGLVRLTLLPELGGRIYRLELLSLGHDLLYANPVLKPTRWGPPEMGWWLAAGGIEFCLAVGEHGYEWGTPWSYAITRQGSAVAVRLADSPEAGRLRAEVTVTLRPGELGFTLQPHIENGTAHSVAVQYWTNAMLAPGGRNRVGTGLQFVFPGDEVTVHSTGDESLPTAWQAMSWPDWRGRDMSLLANWRGWLGFFARPQASHGFAGVYDREAREGVIRSTAEGPAIGVKGFGFGPAGYGLSPELWTDDGSSYVELHGGLTSAFGEPYPLGAGQSVGWSEYWFPLAGIPGVTVAGAAGAAFVGPGVDPAWQLMLAPARRIEGTVELHFDGTSVGSWPVSAAAGSVTEIPLAPGGPTPAPGTQIVLTYRATAGPSETWSGPWRP